MANTKLDTFLYWLRTSNLSAPFVTMWIRTEPKLLASARTQFPKGVQKLSKKHVQLGCSYENCVRNKTQDFSFKADSLWNGKGRHCLNDRYLVEHVDKPDVKYLAYRPIPTKKDIEEWTDLASKNIILPPLDCLPKKSPSKTGVDWRVVMVKNIEQITCGENEYIPVESVQ